MKRIWLWLLVLTVLLCGCGSGSKDAVTERFAPKTVEEAADAAVSPREKEDMQQASMNGPALNALPPSELLEKEREEQAEVITYTVDRDIRHQEVVSEDQVKLAEVRYRLPMLQARDGEGNLITEGTTPERSRALEIVATFNENFDPWREEDATLRQMVLDDYSYRPDMFKLGMYYADELDFSVWQTKRLISIRADSYSYYGGVHPNTMLLGWNFDLAGGTYLHVLSIAEDEQAFRTLVAEELILQADERAARMGVEPGYLYWEDYRSILRNWNDYPVTFDAAGMTVRFSAYELGSYAAGPHEFTISYEFLKPYLGENGRELLGLNDTAS